MGVTESYDQKGRVHMPYGIQRSSNKIPRNGWLRYFFWNIFQGPTENYKFECDEKLDVVQLGESYLNSFSNINPTFTQWVTIFLWLYRFSPTNGCKSN